jgi:hypothetical protein
MRGIMLGLAASTQDSSILVEYLVVAGGGGGGSRAGKHPNGNPFRKNYAGIGFTYNEELNAFIPPKPYNSWILNEETCLWEPPIPCPNNEINCTWNESSLSWVIV